MLPRLATRSGAASPQAASGWRRTGTLLRVHAAATPTTTSVVSSSRPPLSALHHHHHHQNLYHYHNHQQRRRTATFRAVIKLVRHGESMANTGDVSHLEVGDHNVPLTPRGRRQARRAGVRVGPAFVDDCLVFYSPYRRTRQTLAEILVGCGALDRPERLREFEHRAGGDDYGDDDDDDDDDDCDGATGDVRAGATQAAMPEIAAHSLGRRPKPYRIREDPRLR